MDYLNTIKTFIDLVNDHFKSKKVKRDKFLIIAKKMILEEQMTEEESNFMQFEVNEKLRSNFWELIKTVENKKELLRRLKEL